VNQKFTGKERDAETGLDYFGARYFSGAQGRFTSADEPLADQDEHDPQSWNLYSYVRNNPLRYADPTGRDCVTLDNGTTGDNGKGKMCQAVIDADKQKKPDVTVTAQGGNPVLAFGINAFFALDNMANNWFRPLTNAMGVQPSYMQNTPTNNGASGQLAEAGVFVGSVFIGPSGASGRVVRIVEQAPGVIHLEVKTAQGVYEVVANVVQEGSTVVLKQVDIQGTEGMFGGPALIKELRAAAKQLGKMMGVDEVVVEGGVRRSGANPGHTPPAFRVKVN
jgi:RHS repeat-associated protein